MKDYKKKAMEKLSSILLNHGRSLDEFVDCDKKESATVLVKAKEVVIPRFDETSSCIGTIADGMARMDSDFLITLNIKMNRRNLGLLRRDEDFESCCQEDGGKVSVFGVEIILDESVNEIVLYGKNIGSFL